MNPPLRAESDRQALIEGLRDGTIDCIATDHAPHASEEKEVPFEGAAMGVTGLETAFAAVHTDLVLPGTIDLALLIERLAGGAAPFGIERPTLAPGSEANVALCDLGAEWTVGEDGYESRSSNSWCAGTAADRAGADDRRRRPGRLPAAQFQPRGGGMSDGGFISARGRDALRRRPALRPSAGGHRRGRLQHRDDRLPGVGHRPLLRGSDHRLHLSADRQLRGLGGGDGVRPGPRPRRDHAGPEEPRGRRHRRGGLARLARRLRRPRRSAASTPGPSSATSETAARCGAGSSPPGCQRRRRASGSRPSPRWTAPTSPAR